MLLMNGQVTYIDEEDKIRRVEEEKESRAFAGKDGYM